MTDPAKVSSATLWLGIALVASLVVNTFFIGLAAGGRLLDHHLLGLADVSRIGGELPGEAIGPMPPDLDPRMIARMLPESARPEARMLIEERGPEIRDLFRGTTEARGAALDAMRAEPFDRAALEQALAGSLAADDAARAAVHQLTVDIIAGMTPEERAQIGADLGQRFPHHRDWRERHDRWRDRDRHSERRFGREGPPPPSPSEESPSGK